jgi:hypothetical protein
MAYGRRRRGLGLGRGGVLALLTGAAIIGAAAWLGPLRPLPPELQLLALSRDGEFVPIVQPILMRPDTVAAAADVVARAPLVLAARNVGAESARPHGLRIAVPGRYRLTGPDGDALPSTSAPGTPLTQYDLSIDFPELRPNEMPVVLPAYDTLWIEAVLPQYHCSLMVEGVPDFIPAPPYDAETIATVQLYYGFEVPGTERQTGLLTVQLDPSLLTRATLPNPQRARVSVHAESAPRPDLGPLTQVGTRRAQCGDPESPIELRTVLWEGDAGGLMYEVYVDDLPRKLVYDLNLDGRADLEIWDAEGDGGFRALRETSYVIPSFLRPLPNRVAILAQAQEADPGWLQRFVAVHEGPFRFAASPRRVAAARPPPPALPTAAPRPAEPPAVTAEPVDSVWLARFLDASAGPFRFAAALPPEMPRRAEDPTVAADSPAVAPIRPDPQAQPAEPPQAEPEPRRPPPRLLGEPVPWPPRGGGGG